MKAVKYGNIVAILIEWVKSLSNSIDDLFDKYLDQQEQIDNLEERLKQLEWYLAKG
jgi:peptidoglycan hydrolase CwlO-like protein